MLNGIVDIRRLVIFACVGAPAVAAATRAPDATLSVPAIIGERRLDILAAAPRTQR